MYNNNKKKSTGYLIAYFMFGKIYL